MNKLDTQYTDLIKLILDEGEVRNDRTGIGTVGVFGHQMRFKMDDGFPLLTNRRIHTKSLIHELLWFLASYDDEYKKFGNTNVKYLCQNGVSFWNEWVYEEYKKKMIEKWSKNDLKDEKTLKPIKMLSIKDFEKKIKKDDDFALKYGDLGPVYGKQWMDWGGHHEDVEKTKSYNKTNAETSIVDHLGWEKIYFKGIDQMSELIDGLENNPDSRRHIVSAWNVAEIENMLLPPCFVGDTKILTNTGYKSIEGVSKNDLLYSHKGVYRKINKKYITDYNGDIYNIRLRYSPYDISCTPNHPFLVKDKGFLEVKDINENDYIGIKINKKNNIPKIKVQYGVNQYSKDKINDYIIDQKDEFYMMGYFLGDGWTIESEKTNNKYRIFFSFNKKDINIINKIKKVLSLSKNSEGKNVVKFECRNKKWYKILSEFKRLAHNKTIPEWIIDSPIELIKEFINGYVDADGHVMKTKTSITTTSDNIAFNMQRLYIKIGKVASLYYQKRKKKTHIEGRLVNQRNTYNITVHEKHSKNLAIFDDDFLWLKMRKIKKTNEKRKVYNFDTNNDHTYTVQNFVTHNCHLLFQFYTIEMTGIQRYKLFNEWVKNNGIDVTSMSADDAMIHYKFPTRKISLQMYQRSADLFLGIPFNIASYSLLLHMVAQQVGMYPWEFIWTGGDVHLYSNSIEASKELIERKPFDLPTLKLKKKDSLRDYRFEDFEIVDYQYHPNIKVDIAV